MSNRLQGGASAGVTDFSLFVLLRNATTNQSMTGLAHGDITATYTRLGETPVAITPVALSAVDDAHTDGGWFEVSNSSHPGLYRLDLPDAAIAEGADFVAVTIQASGAYAFHQVYPVSDASAHHLAKGDKRVVNVAGQWKLRIYRADDPATIWHESNIDHPGTPSSVVAV